MSKFYNQSESNILAGFGKFLNYSRGHEIGCKFHTPVGIYVSTYKYRHTKLYYTNMYRVKWGLRLSLYRYMAYKTSFETILKISSIFLPIIEHRIYCYLHFKIDL